MKKYHLCILCLFIIVVFTACSNSKGKVETSKGTTMSENKGNTVSPPEILITLKDKNIPWVLGLNDWNGFVYNRKDIFQSIMEKGSGIKVPYFKLGGTIAIEMKGTAPDKIVLKDYILKQDGVPKYTEREINVVPIKLIDGKGTFKFDMHIAAMLSSNSKDYEPGNTIRGFRLTCNWGSNECEYGFIIKTDANYFKE